MFLWNFLSSVLQVCIIFLYNMVEEFEEPAGSRLVKYGVLWTESPLVWKKTHPNLWTQECLESRLLSVIRTIKPSIRLP